MAGNASPKILEPFHFYYYVSSRPIVKFITTGSNQGGPECPEARCRKLPMKEDLLGGILAGDACAEKEHFVKYTLHSPHPGPKTEEPKTENPKTEDPKASNPKPQTLNRNFETSDPKPQTRNLKAGKRNPEPKRNTSSSAPSTQNLQSERFLCALHRFDPKPSILDPNDPKVFILNLKPLTSNLEP